MKVSIEFEDPNLTLWQCGNVNISTTFDKNSKEDSKKFVLIVQETLKILNNLVSDFHNNISYTEDKVQKNTTIEIGGDLIKKNGVFHIKPMNDTELFKLAQTILNTKIQEFAKKIGFSFTIACSEKSLPLQAKL